MKTYLKKNVSSYNIYEIVAQFMFCKWINIRSPEHCLKLEKLAGSATHKQSKTGQSCVILKVQLVYVVYPVMKAKTVLFM